MTDEQWVLSVAQDAIRPDPELLVSEWADAKRYLSEKASPEPGPWRTSRTPYLREIMDCLSRSGAYAHIREVDFVKGAQIAGTEAGLNFIGYCIDQSPGPMICVMPTEKTMKDNSKLRIEPMIQDCECLREKVNESKTRDSSNTILMKEFPGGYLSMIGANSGADFRSKPAASGFGDEVDGWPLDVGGVDGEGDSVSLFRRAFRNFPRRKIFLCSTPTIEGMSRIQSAYDTSDRRRYYVPCLHCGGFQVLKWSNVKWEKGNPQGAYYVCEHCGAILHNHDKTEMLARGEWRADVPDYRGDRVGFQLSSLYSPVGWLSWGDAAEMWEEAQGDDTKLKTFINTVLGETWKTMGEVPDWEKLYNRRERYEFNTVPAGGLFLTAGVDVQKNYIVCEIVAWGRNKESWSIDYRVLPGDVSDMNSAAWTQLDAILTESFPHESGAVLQINCMAVDTGYQGNSKTSGVHTQTVYNWCRRYPVNRVIPIKGMGSLPVILGQPKAVDVYTNGRRSKNALKLWGVGVSHLKGELYGWLRLPKPEQDLASPGYCHFPEYEEEYFKQLTAEQLVKREIRATRQVHYEWVKMRDRNEVLDCRIYARAAAALRQIDKFQAQHWDAIESAIWGDRAPKHEEVPTERIPIPQSRRGYPQGGRRIMSPGIRL
jgi:phage terminase large subunit GpA-like protein